MSFLNKSQLKSHVRRAIAPLRPQVAVLLYHRIFEPLVDPWDLSVSPANFEEHLMRLQKNYTVLRLSELVDCFYERRLPRHGVVLTFDDGYADNFQNGLPLLERYKIPATFFVTSGAVGRGCEFWWDSLERILLLDAPIPETLMIEINGENYFWLTRNRAERKKMFWTLHPILQALPPNKLEEVMTQLLAWANLDSVGRSDYHPLTEAELKKFAQSPYVEIGGHTVTHSSLSDLSSESQYGEMSQSRRALEQMIDTNVTTVAYPYGRYNADSVSMAAKAGYEMAFTVEQKLVRKQKNPLRLGRFGVENWNGCEFERNLKAFFQT